ncbi:MAG: SDR family oxidoreductase [Alphaproteobacteria bacterium]|nr:SDR family oxidoreductase [Alphaproteobacteria bacterium]
MTIQDLKGKRAIITGGSNGIGEAVVIQLLNDGAQVASLDLVEPKASRGDAFFHANLSTAEDIARGTELAISHLGGVDILVNVVGGSNVPAGGPMMLEDSHWQSSFDLNLFPAVRMDRMVLPHMIRQRAGAIVHITSIARHLPLPESLLAYGAAKAALANYSKGLATYYAPMGIRVNAIAPGFIETAGSRKLVAEMAKASGQDFETTRTGLMNMLGGIPLGHPGTPADIGHMVSFLVSERASFITGVEYMVDGGTRPTL